MSGYAGITGEPGHQPLLPPIALTDEVTGLVSAFATMVAIHSGVGQVVDTNLLESMFQFMGPLIGAYRLLGYEQALRRFGGFRTPGPGHLPSAAPTATGSRSSAFAPTPSPKR